MNKKFSTLLTAGLLATSALCSSAWAQVTVNGATLDAAKDPATDKTWAVGPYFLVVDKDGNGHPDVGELALYVLPDEKDETTFAYYTLELQAENNGLNLPLFSWSLSEGVNTNKIDNTKTYDYSLKNVGLSTFLAFKNDGTLENVIATSKHNPNAEKDGDKRFAVFSAGNTKADAYEGQFKQKGFLYLLPKGSATDAGLTIEENSVSLSSTASSLILCTLDTKTLDPAEAAKTMNAEMAGEGFSFEFGVDNKYEWVNDILTDTKLKAFYVTEKDLENGMKIPAGLYFATEYPEELVGTNEIGTEELFKQCTFVAVDPMVNYDINKADRGNGVGYEFTTVLGNDMNFFVGGDKDPNYSHGEEVYVGNACFTVEVPNAVTADDVYNIVAKDMHVFVTSDKNADKKHEKKSGYIGCVTDQLKNYLVTTGSDQALDFTTTNSTLLDGDDLAEFLQKEDAPSVYTIQFVSGEKEEGATEYKQYLTVNRADAVSFHLATTVDFNEADPMYQFVVTGIDKTDKTITFANRQTKKSFTVSLYENKDDVYTVLPVGYEQLNVEDINGEDNGNNEDEDEIVTFAVKSLANKKIVLTQYTVEDKFATFVNRADNMGLVQFELALNEDAGAAFYVGAAKDTDGELDFTGTLKGYVDGENMTQFELIKNEKPSYVLNKYVYLKDKRILTSVERDTVAYYKYAIKAFVEGEKDYYLDYATKYTLKDETKVADADKFIIKQQLDGSVSLINSGDVTAAMTMFAQVADLEKDKEEAWTNEKEYDLPYKFSKGLKTFMVDETPAVSYEAVPQHVSFGLVDGGFLTNKNNDAFQSIATEASEDLTFWLDTTKTDVNIPSFFITKAGQFLFNAKDSSAYYTPRGNYRFNLANTKDGKAKLIFKAGELVSSDTLRTVVDGKSVLVAEKDNQPKKIKGGLNQFRFQIVKAEDGSDDYVIRQGRTSYVQMINHYFYLDANKATAVRFTIEQQSTPTANEGVEIAGVKVIAGEGNVTIAGAAGKKVVISNILGQVVANTVVSSDNATIAAPQGIVVVAVEGEEAVKAIVK